MNTEIANAVNAAGDKAQYDARVKRLLAQKMILAHILVKTVDEFKGMKPENVVQYIEGEPQVGVIPIEQEYNIPINNEFREDVRIMCNLSTGIEERATEKTTENIILNMYENKFSLEQIALATKKSTEEIEKIIKEKELLLV